MVDFGAFDKRHYRTADVLSGYGEWAATYEEVVEDAMDIELLEALREVPWDDVGRAADLGCGTGRIGAWLRTKGVSSIDGVDLTPEMLARAERHGVYNPPDPGRHLIDRIGVGGLRHRRDLLGR